MQNCAEFPILAIETKEDTFENLAETRLSDPDSWKKFIQSAVPGDRLYLSELQNLLKEMAEESSQEGGASNVILYNFRRKGCIAYRLGRAS